MEGLWLSFPICDTLDINFRLPSGCVTLLSFLSDCPPTYIKRTLTSALLTLLLFISDCPPAIMNMTLPSLPSGFHCRVNSSCTKVDCCVEVGFLKKNIHLELEVDICSRKISFSIEKLRQEIPIFNYTLGIFVFHFVLFCFFLF